jgi:undecaprenyl-diphosphatase
MTAGRALRLDRTSAAVFSFLMLMPITAGAAVLKVPEALREHGITAPIAVGVVAAAVSSALAIAVLLRFVQRHSFAVFATYRFALAAAVFVVLYARTPGRG